MHSCPDFHYHGKKAAAPSSPGWQPAAAKQKENLLNPGKFQDLQDRTTTGCLRSQNMIVAGSAAGARHSLPYAQIIAVQRSIKDIIILKERCACV